MARRFRYFQFDRAKVDEKNRTIPIAFSSETPVARCDREYGEFDEVLSHDEKDVDLERMKDSAPLLLNHDIRSQIGCVEAAAIGSDKMGRAIVRFGNSALAEEIYRDVKDGIRKHVSVGYDIRGIVSDTKDANNKRTLKMAWIPHEVSIVGIPADTKVGVGRAKGKKKLARLEQRNLSNDECVGYCYSAESMLIDLMEEMEDEGDAGDDAAIDQIKEAIAACSVAIKGLCYWSEKTAAECVEVCRETAEVLKDTVTAIGESDQDEEDVQETIDCLNMAVEKLLENAGGEEAPAVAAGNQTRQLDNKTLSTGGQPPKNPETDDMKRNLPLLDAAPAAAAGGGAAAPAAAAPVITVAELRNQENTRIREITATVDLLVKDHPTAAEKFREKGTKAIAEGMDVRDFKASMVAEIPGAKPARQITLADITNGDVDAQKHYSVARGIQSCILRKSQTPDGLEGDVHEEMRKRGLMPAGAGGFQVPFDAMISKRMSRRQQRDLNVNTFGQGGAFVQTSILTPIIEILRNRMVCDRLGVQGMAGLEGNIAIPRQTGAATAFSLPEQTTLTKSTQALDQVMLTPHRVGAWNNYSRQLLLQSSVDVENFLREDLMKVVAIKWDNLILQGQGGGSEPTGVLNTPGIGSIMFGGTATWAQIVAFETALSVANADLGNMAFVTSPTVRGRMKAVAQTGVGVTSVVPIFLWQKGAWADGSNDGEMNGYRAAATNQILNNLVFFGNWEDCIHALWGGYDVIVDPYTQATDGTNRITVNTFGDVALRHAVSFCVSADSGAQ